MIYQLTLINMIFGIISASTNFYFIGLITCNKLVPVNQGYDQSNF